VTLHPFLDEKSHHLIGEKELEMMKETAILLNVSRGSVVDEVALVKALKEGKIGGAGLDVYENEPKMADGNVYMCFFTYMLICVCLGLKELKNVVVVPHIGSASVETRYMMGELAVNSIIARAKGEKLVNCVNPEALE